MAIVNLIVGALIALLPLYTKVEVVDIGRLSKDSLFLCAAMGLVMFLPVKRSLSRLSIITLIYGLLVIAFNRWAEYSINVQMQSVSILIGITFLVQYFRAVNNDGQEYLLNGMAIGCLIQSLLVLTKHNGLDIYGFALSVIHGKDFQFVSIRATGSLGNPNLVASYISLTMISLYRGAWPIVLPMAITALLLTESLMGIAAGMAGFIYYLNFKINKASKLSLYLGATIAMVSIYFTGLSGHDTNRFSIWKSILNSVGLKHFLIGNGPGWFADHPLFLRNDLPVIQEHNEFLSAFNIFGIVGVALIAAVFWRFLRSKDQSPYFPSIVFAGFCNSYGHFTLHQSTTAIILLVSVAICFAQGSEYVSNLER